MKLCRIDEATGKVTFTADSMDKKQTPAEYVLQTFCVCLLMTQGTQLQYTTLGGNVIAMTKKPRKRTLELLRLEMGESVERVSQAISGMNPGNDDYIFDRAVLKEVSRKDGGGLVANIEIHFANATPVSAGVPIS